MTGPGPTQDSNSGTGTGLIPIGPSEWTRTDLNILIIIKVNLTVIITKWTITKMRISRSPPWAAVLMRGCCTRWRSTISIGRRCGRALTLRRWPWKCSMLSRWDRPFSLITLLQYQDLVFNPDRGLKTQDGPTPPSGVVIKSSIRVAKKRKRAVRGVSTVFHGHRRSVPVVFGPKGGGKKNVETMMLFSLLLYS